MKVFTLGCKPWSKRDDELLCHLHVRRYPIMAVAKIMGRTEYAVRHRKTKLHLGRMLSDDIDNIIRRTKKHLKRTEGKI